MKFQFKYLTGVLVVMVAMASCKKNNLVVDQDPLIPPAYVKFNVLKADVVVLTFVGAPL